MIKRIEDMHAEVKNKIKTTNQRCEKYFKDHARRIYLHDTAKKNIETQLGRLSEAVQGRNNGSFQGFEKGAL